MHVLDPAKNTCIIMRVKLSLEGNFKSYEAFQLRCRARHWICTQPILRLLRISVLQAGDSADGGEGRLDRGAHT